jgi:hypothetical protein
MIVEILGWKFVDIADADSYIAAIDSRLGFPSDDTLHYTFYSIGQYEGNVFPWLNYDPKIVQDLGEPYIFFIENGV